MNYCLSLWLLLPCHDAPAETYNAGILYETDPMPEAEARAKHAAWDYATAMADVENDGESVLLCLSQPGGSIMEIRELKPTAQPNLMAKYAGFQPYADRPTAVLQERREALLRVPRLFTSEEKTEMQAIERELQARNVLSIGIDF